MQNLHLWTACVLVVSLSACSNSSEDLGTNSQSQTAVCEFGDGGTPAYDVWENGAKAPCDTHEAEDCMCDAQYDLVGVTCIEPTVASWNAWLAAIPAPAGETRPFFERLQAFRSGAEPYSIISDAEWYEYNVILAPTNVTGNLADGWDTITEDPERQMYWQRKTLNNEAAAEMCAE